MTRTVAPSTVTKGRLKVVPGAAITALASHAPAPRGRRQKFSDVVLLSGPYHAMYAVPAASTATPGLCPAPIVRGVAALAPAGAVSSSPAMTHAIARAGLRIGRIIWASRSPVGAVFGDGAGSMPVEQGGVVRRELRADVVEVARDGLVEGAQHGARVRRG